LTDAAREYSAAIVDWREHHRVMCAIRRAVFINEQGVSEDSAGNGIATGRLCAHDAGAGVGSGGQIGRMAVLAAWRGRGVGGAILTRLLEAADARGMRMVSLHAQTHARAFYAARGFVEYGDIFMEAGIKHIRMSRRLR